MNKKLQVTGNLNKINDLLTGQKSIEMLGACFISRIASSLEFSGNCNLHIRV